MRMTDDRYAALLAALRRDPSNLNAAAKEVHCTWRTVREAWEGRIVGRRAIKEIIAEEDAVRRSVLAEKDEERLAAVAKIRDELMADNAARLAHLDAREADVERRLAEYEAVVRETEARAKRLHEARVEHGRADGNAVREQETLLCRGLRQMQSIAIGLLTGGLSPDAVGNLMLAIRRGATDKAISPRDAMAVTRALLAAVKPLAEAAKLTAEMERLVAGEPTHIGEMRHSLEPATLEVLEAGRRDLDRVLGQIRPPAQLEDAEVEAVPELPAPAQGEPERNSGDAPSQSDASTTGLTTDEHTEKGDEEKG